MSGTNKIGDLPIIKKHFGDLEIIKEVLNGSTIYESVKTYTITSTITNGSYSGDTEITNTASVTISANSGYSLPSTISVTGATYTYDSTTGVVSLSNPTGNVTIEATCVASYPVKSDIILLNLDGNGNQRYRVLKNVSGTIYEIVWIPSADRQSFGSATSLSSGTNGRYNGGNVDVALNTTFYNTLTQTAKSAIVDKTFTSSYYYSKSETLTRHIYLIAYNDVTGYFDTTPTGEQVREMMGGGFINNPNELFTRSVIWSNGHVYVLLLGENNGNTWYSDNYNPKNNYLYRPAMQIDLSKIDFTIEA